MEENLIAPIITILLVLIIFGILWYKIKKVYDEMFDDK